MWSEYMYSTAILNRLFMASLFPWAINVKCNPLLLKDVSTFIVFADGSFPLGDLEIEFETYYLFKEG